MTLEIQEALDIIENEVKALTFEIVPLENVVGRVLAQDCIATQNLPSFDNSAMDGYAVCQEHANNRYKIERTIFAGDKVDGLNVCTNKVYKIMTGAPIPLGCEAIVPIEDVEFDKDDVIFKEISKGKHIRPQGEDIAKGEILLGCGTKIEGYHVALFASQGISHVRVYKKPKVAVFASGEELKMHFETVESHQIYNSNTPTFLARAKELGAEVTFIGSCKDDLSDLKHHIQRSLDADLIVTSGGVSVGDADFTKEAFDAFSIERLFDRVNIKPGKPTTLGRIGKSLVLNLPGNPLAALVNFELFGHKCLLKLEGNKASHHAPITCKAKNDFSIRKGRVTVLPGIWDGEFFEPTSKRSPGMISALACCNAVVILDSKVETCKQNSTLSVILLHGSKHLDTQKNLITSGFHA